MSPKTVGVLIVLMAITYSVVEAHHFGNNIAPKSDAEMVCDGIGILIASIGWAVLAFSGKRDK